MIYEALVNVCRHCKGSVDIRNPSGFCDHLYYPEQCEICKNPDNAVLITKGRIFNHRDGMSELERFRIENDAKPMTAEERTDTCHTHPSCARWKCEQWLAICSQIQQACAEARAEGIREQEKRCGTHCKPLWEQAYAKGFSDALDKAAQKVQSFQWSDDNDSEVTEILAHKIRALERDK